MKPLIIIFSLFFVSFNSFHKTKTSGLNDTVDLVSKSFRNGQVALLTKAMPEYIELKIDSEKINIPKVSKERASFILNNFFKKNPPSDFKYIYQGDNTGNLKYCVANYSSGNKNYLLYLLIQKTPNNQYLLKTLQLRTN